MNKFKVSNVNSGSGGIHYTIVNESNSSQQIQLCAQGVYSNCGATYIHGLNRLIAYISLYNKDLVKEYSEHGLTEKVLKFLQDTFPDNLIRANETAKIRGACASNLIFTASTGNSNKEQHAEQIAFALLAASYILTGNTDPDMVITEANRNRGSNLIWIASINKEQ